MEEKRREHKVTETLSYSQIGRLFLFPFAHHVYYQRLEDFVPFPLHPISCHSFGTYVLLFVIKLSIIVVYRKLEF